MLLGAASRLETPQVLMLNMSQDEVFSVEGTHALFDAIPGRKKRLMFWEGDHVGDCLPVPPPSRISKSKGLCRGSRTSPR